jgi:hypothetical protein
MNFIQSGDTLLFRANALTGAQTTLFPGDGRTQLTQLSDGTVAFSWHTTLPGIVELFNPATGAEVAQNVILGDLSSRFGATFYNAVDYASVAALGSGGLVATFQSDIPVGNLADSRNYLQVYSATGVPLATIREFDDPNELNYVDEPEVFTTSGGFLFVQEVSYHDFELRFFTSAGAEIGTPTQVDNLEFIKALTLSNGQTLVLTKHDHPTPNSEDNWQVRFFNSATGQQIGDTQNHVLDIPAGQALNGVTIWDVAERPGGGYAVIYRQWMAGDIQRTYVELFKDDGTTHRSVPSPREIDFASAGLNLNQNRPPKIVPLPDGGYIVLIEADSAASEYDIYGAVFNAAEAQVSPFVRLSQDLAGDQEYMDAILLADGRLAISYVDDWDRGLGEGRVQIFDVSTDFFPVQGTEGDDASGHR